MWIQKLFAAAVAVFMICAARSAVSADDMRPVNHPGTRNLSSSPRFDQFAFNDDEPGPAPSDARGAKDPKPRRGPDDDFGGPGGSGFGPGGPKRAPGEPGGPGGRGRGPGGPGGPDGDKGPPPPDGERHGPGPRPGGDGPRHGPDGARFDGFMRHPDPEMIELLKKEDELDNQANDLATQYQRAASADKEKVQKQIEETVNKQFEVRQKRRKLQLDRMQKDLDELRTIYENKNASRDALIKGRVQQLLNGGGLGF